MLNKSRNCLICFLLILVRQGLAQNLLDFILKTYLHNEIYTFASLSAKDFFLKNGFELIRENKVIKEGQNLKKNFNEKRCDL